jgi:hypothetical protein
MNREKSARVVQKDERSNLVNERRRSRGKERRGEKLVLK